MTTTETDRSNSLKELLFNLDRDKVIDFLDETASLYKHVAYVNEVLLISTTTTERNVFLLSSLISSMPETVCNDCSSSFEKWVSQHLMGQNTLVELYVAGDFNADGHFYSSYYRVGRCDICRKYTFNTNTEAYLKQEDIDYIKAMTDSDILDIVSNEEASFYVREILKTDYKHLLDKEILDFTKKFIKLHNI